MANFSPQDLDIERMTWMLTRKRKNIIKKETHFLCEQSRILLIFGIF